MRGVAQVRLHPPWGEPLVLEGPMSGSRSILIRKLDPPTRWVITPTRRGTIPTRGVTTPTRRGTQNPISISHMSRGIAAPRSLENPIGKQLMWVSTLTLLYRQHHTCQLMAIWSSRHSKRSGWGTCSSRAPAFSSPILLLPLSRPTTPECHPGQVSRCNPSILPGPSLSSCMGK